MAAVHAQDVAAGDGTTSVTVICGALLRKCLELLERGVHPTVISDSFARAAEKASEVLAGIAIPVDLADREALIRAANTCACPLLVPAPPWPAPRGRTLGRGSSKVLSRRGSMAASMQGMKLRSGEARAPWHAMEDGKPRYIWGGRATSWDHCAPAEQTGLCLRCACAGR